MHQPHALQIVFNPPDASEILLVPRPLLERPLEAVVLDVAQTIDTQATGEQKALLVSIILANLSLLPLRKNRTRILLLDEVVAHLDKGRRSFLFDRLFQINTQVWITGTDKNIFSSLGDKVQHFTVENSMVS